MKNLTGKSIRKSTSLSGRFQFSVEKAYNVRTLTPRLLATLVIFFTVSIPCLCPAIRGKCLFLAQRPFPSMIIAI